MRRRAVSPGAARSRQLAPGGRRVLLSLDGGPLSGAGVTVPDWPWPVPQSVIWASTDAAGRWVVLGPDKELLSMVAGRARDGGLDWIPYRRASAEPVRLRTADVWRYEWDRIQAERSGRPG